MRDQGLVGVVDRSECLLGDGKVADEGVVQRVDRGGACPNPVVGPQGGEFRAGDRQGPDQRCENGVVGVLAGVWHRDTTAYLTRASQPVDQS